MVVTKNGVELTEQDPHYASGGDYTVDYAAGRVTLLEAITPGVDVIEATYHHATSSLFTIFPKAGTKLLVEQVEVQFSKSMQMLDSVVFTIFGYVDVFAPELSTANGGEIPAGTKIPLGTILYKTMKDLMNDAQRAYPSYPALGGAGWRGIQEDTYVLDWDYLRGTLLVAAYGMELRCYLEHDSAFTGYATATFYCSSESE